MLPINYTFGFYLQHQFILVIGAFGFLAEKGCCLWGSGFVCWCRMGSSDEKVVAVIMVGGPTKGMKVFMLL